MPRRIFKMDKQIQQTLENSFLNIMQAIDRAYEEFAKAIDMTYISMIILDEIYAHPEGCTQKQICEAVHYPKQTVNLSIKAFWENGYVELRELSADRRNKAVYLTKKGLAYAKKTVGQLEKIDRTAAAALTPEQQEMLVLLTRIYGEAFCDGVRNAIKKGK